jgi:hypothetical protein
MATWTNVSNTVLEPGDPIRSVDIIAIKENIIALSEGASGAPKIQAAAIASGVLTNTTNVLTATAGATVGALGTYCLAYATSSIAIGNTVAGSNLLGVNTAGSQVAPGFSGTWRNMGCTSRTPGDVSSFLRIS